MVFHSSFPRAWCTGGNLGHVAARFCAGHKTQTCSYGTSGVRWKTRLASHRLPDGYSGAHCCENGKYYEIVVKKQMNFDERGIQLEFFVIAEKKKLNEVAVHV